MNFARIFFSTCIVFLFSFHFTFSQESEGFSAEIITDPLVSSFLPSIKILLGTNNYKFFVGSQRMIDDINPSFFKKTYSPEWIKIVNPDLDRKISPPFWGRMTVSSDIGSLLTGLLNIDAKIHLLKEARLGIMPQISIGGSFSYGLYNLLPSGVILPEYIQELTYQGGSTYLTFAKSLKKDFKFFFGYRLSFGQMKLIMDEKLIDEETKIAITAIRGPQFKEFLKEDGFSRQWILNDLLIGSSVLSEKGRETSILLGYQLSPQNIYLKIENSGRHFVYGVGYMPDTIFSIRPYVKLRYLF